MKLITLALALFATGADAACTIPNVANQKGFATDDATGATGCTGVSLANDASCTIKCDTGYTCDSGTLTFTCNAAGTDTLSAEPTVKTTGCAVMWKQATDAGKVQNVGNADDVTNVGICQQCTGTAGFYVAAADFGDTAGTCGQCPTDLMGTAGTCVEGCPADAYQTAGAAGTLTAITCAACDKTKYKLETAAQAVMDASTTAQTGTASTGCAAAGCRADYEQTAGAAVAAADCIETATKANADSFCTAIDAIDTVQCNAISQPANLAACEAVKKQKADGTGATTTAACTYTAAVSVTSVTATATACDNAGVPANAAACTTANAGCEIKAAVVAVAPVCAACAAGFVTQTNTEQTGAVNTGAATCLACNPLIVGACRTGCPANYYQKVGTTAGAIQCLACPSGKELANAGVLTTVQTETACTTPAAAASGAFRSVANAAATAVAASFAAAALM